MSEGLVFSYYFFNHEVIIHFMKDLYTLFAELAITYELHEHDPFYTCEQADTYYADIEAGKVKNLFLRDRKGEKYYLLMIPSEKSVNMKFVEEILSEKGMSFASKRD